MEFRPRSTEDIANFWRAKGLSVRASNCLAKAGILSEGMLVAKLTTFEDVLALRNCGRLTAEEIWTLIQHLRINRAASLGEEEANTLSAYIHEPHQEEQVGMVIKRSKRGIRIEMLEGDEIYIRETLRGDSYQGCEWEYLNFDDVAEKTQQAYRLTRRQELWEGTPHSETDFAASRIREVPLLEMKISEEIWWALQNISIHRIKWSVRAEEGINHQDCQTLADVARIPPSEWLNLRNFGRTYLYELQDKITDVTNNPELFLESAEISDGVPIESLLDLGHFILEKLKERDEQEVIKHRYGYEDAPKNLKEVGYAIGISPGRAGHIKKYANAKINQWAEHDFIAKCISNLLGELITVHLAGKNGFCSVEELRQIISRKLGWGKTEQWIINWFDEAFGEEWICLGADNYEVIDNVCYLKSEHGSQEFFAGLVRKLRRYGYRPLTLEECVQLYTDTTEQPFDSKQLLSFIKSHPELKIYEYGVTYIGLREWVWFAPEKQPSEKEQADLVEWYLRMTNEPSTAEAIADGIWAKLGNFRLTPFEVAEACENNSLRFKVDEDNHYGLYVWEDASKRKQAIESILERETLHIEQIVGQLSPENSDEAGLIVAALNRYKETFVEVTPFNWALKEHEETKDVDYTELDFEELIPK